MAHGLRKELRAIFVRAGKIAVSTKDSWVDPKAVPRPEPRKARANGDRVDRARGRDDRDDRPGTKRHELSLTDPREVVPFVASLE
jgi:hypothetical protein